MRKSKDEIEREIRKTRERKESIQDFLAEFVVLAHAWSLSVIASIGLGTMIYLAYGLQDTIAYAVFVAPIVIMMCASYVDGWANDRIERYGEDE